MNCKPGDLAIIVKATNPEHKNHIGKIVKCIEFDIQENYWIIDLVIREGSATFAYDYQLRPIRDPGDDAQDETLQWLPVPKLTKNADKVVKDTAKGLQKEKA